MLCGLVHRFEVNRLKYVLPVKMNVELLEKLAHLMDSPGGMVKHQEVRKIAGKVSWWPVSCPS